MQLTHHGLLGKHYSFMYCRYCGLLVIEDEIDGTGFEGIVIDVVYIVSVFMQIWFGYGLVDGFEVFHEF